MPARAAAVITKAKRLANQSTTSLSSFDPYEYSNLYSVNTNEARARNQVSEYSTKVRRFPARCFVGGCVLWCCEPGSTC